MGKILHHFVPLLRENLLKQQINKILFFVVFIFFHHEGFIGSARNIERQVQDLALYTQTSSGTCTEKRSRAACSDTTNLDYFWNEMKVEILQ